MRSVIIPAVLLPILVIAMTGWYKNRKLPFFSPAQAKSTVHPGWKYALTACCALTYLGMFLLISAAWLQGDDWWMIGMHGVAEHFSSVFHCYIDWVSRVGEILVRSTGISYDRWEPRLLNPLVVMLAPLALFSLCKREGESLFSGKGLAFYGFALAVTLMNAYLPLWKNFFDYANCANYVYPCVAIAWFLSFYRNDSLGKNSSHALCIGLFILGALCGWGTEASTAVLLPMLTLLLLLAKGGKTPKWTPHAYAGYWGFLCGAVMLLLSPALVHRTARTLEGMKLNVADMTALQKQEFLQNLSWDNLSLIKSEGVILIKDFPLFDRIWYFLPYWGERFLACCWVGLIVIAVLAGILLLEQGRKSLCTLGVALVIVGISLAMASSYLVSCIPGFMSFFPACFCMTMAACFLFLRLKHTGLWLGAAAVLLTAAFSLFIPAGVEAWQYKHYEHERWANIQAQIAAGEQDIVLPRPYPVEPKDPLKLIGALQLGDDPKAFPNNMAAGSLKINSIRQAK